MNSDFDLPHLDHALLLEVPSAPEQSRRNLGLAIIVAAIQDYHCLEKEAHESAANFLFPRTQAWQRQYDWALAMAPGLNPTWLREALDKNKAAWDVQRAARLRCTELTQHRLRRRKLNRETGPTAGLLTFHSGRFNVVDITTD